VREDLLSHKKGHSLPANLDKSSFGNNIVLVPINLQDNCKLGVSARGQKDEKTDVFHQHNSSVSRRKITGGGEVSSSLVFSSRRLRHYYRNFNINVRTNYPIKQNIAKTRAGKKNDNMVGGVV